MMNLRFFSQEVKMEVDNETLDGILAVPHDAKGIVIFSHGSGSGRFSPRNKLVAERLHDQQIGTLLLDLLTPAEDRVNTNRFDIALLAHRLVGVTQWLEQFEACDGCAMGYFGASTGAASALKASTYLPQLKAIVSRGGRPEMAADILNKVQCPTMLIVGSRDEDVVRLNEQAYGILTCEKRFEVVDGASHLFEEDGKMDNVIELASSWFNKYLKGVPASVS
jgi:putative phosphoribosyl transferase